MSVAAPPITIRAFEPADAPQVRAVVEAAFAGSDLGLNGEGALVEALRENGAMAGEWVALAGDALIGHVLFSALDAGDGPALSALAPVSVAPPSQRSGVGGRLIRAGLDAMRAQGFGGAIVLGDPAYFPKFGFSAEAARTLRAPFSRPSFMAIALIAGALDSRAIHYHRAFDLGDAPP